MKRLLQAINVLPEAFIVVQGSGCIVAANSAARELFGTHLKEGHSLAEVISDPVKKLLRCLQLWSSSRQFLPASLQIPRDGSVSTIRCDGAVMEPATAGCPSLLLLRCVPRSESASTQLFIQLNEKIEHLWRQIAEQKARDSDRLMSLATAAAVFAHEVSNPLNAIAMSIQLLEAEVRERNDLSSQHVRDSIVEANKEIERLTSLLRDFRSFARPQFIEFQPTDLAATLQEVLTPEVLLFRAAGVRVEFDIGSLPLLMLDRDKIKQAILNLCKNAVEAMPEGGCLTLRGYLCKTTNAVVLEVSDTGIGIPEGIDVFEIFRTTKPTGTGLGLPLVSQIISAHHGTITYVTEPAKGTTFKILLPMRSISGL
ncbi:MAG: hypothetical protein GEU77_20085 [Deltaproteobacteria bacterium]|nr:hypothetical protein [Deltaproteobacteria bacterium]